jgi:hypothetical protein
MSQKIDATLKIPKPHATIKHVPLHHDRGLKSKSNPKIITQFGAIEIFQ